MQHRVKVWLEDLVTAIETIDIYLGSQRNYFVYVNNTMLRQSIELNLILIGESINNILRKDPTIRITNARKIVNLRNLIVHTYDDVDHTTIWSIIVNHLPLLKTEAQSLLEGYVEE